MGVHNQKEKEVVVKKYSSLDIEQFKEDDKYLGIFAKLELNGQEVSRNYYLFKKDKDINYPKADITIKQISDKEISILSNSFVRGLYIDTHDNDLVLSDNYFNLIKGEKRVIKANKKIDISTIEILCVNNL